MYNLQNFSNQVNYSVKEIINDNKDEILDVFYNMFSDEVAFTYEDTIEYLANQVSEDNFYKKFDNALENISNNPRNENFGIETAEGNREPLFEPITGKVELSGRNNFAKSIIGIIGQDKFDFSDVFEENFDFYSRIFEYLINDYNVASGTYAEYFTPQAISKIIAKILVNMSPIEDTSYDIYDPSAGSGSLILHLANELGEGSFGKKAQVFTQDISAKSSRFLRINMLLNGLTESLDHIIKGDTLLSPAHYKEENDPSSGIKQFDYITSNPPFKMDFSSTRNTIEEKWLESEEHDGIKRYFAGIPNIPNKKKESMGIYLCFVQHILWSLKSNGKAAIVVPTGFITANGIPLKIKKEIIKNKWLKGVISMPPNIFANTGTNVSVLFIDKTNSKGDIILIDASTLGEKTKINGIQKTILNKKEIKLIEDAFLKQEEINEFSVKVNYDDIISKNYSFSAAQYFDIKMEYKERTEMEIVNELNDNEKLLYSDFNETIMTLKNKYAFKIVKKLFDYWFLQFDFPNNNNKPYKTSGGDMKLDNKLNIEIPSDWSVDSLDKIAKYVNGLACQKYRPINNKDKLPVIKITEMHDGITEKTEFVRNDIDSKHIITEGDILFSWSATLETMIWHGQKCGLNQHIFKVIPKGYGKFYVYMQLSSYIINFIKMAESRKTTMGHITKDHLLQSRIPLPPKELTLLFDEVVNKMLEKLLIKENLKILEIEKKEIIKGNL